MLSKFNLTFSLLIVLVLLNFAANAGMAQQGVESTQQIQTASPTVTASGSGESVRFSAPGNITHIRLEGFSSAGQKVFDSGMHDGNVLDWRWQDQKPFGADSYLCLVTVQSLSGKISRKLAHISFANQKVALKPVDPAELNPVQTQALGATETDTPLTIIDEDQSIAATVIAHDGTDGQMIRGRGALTFRLGNFFSGLDQEQMRLTEEGNLGIGTSNPQARLDVAGTIRAQRFLMAKPNSPSGNKTTTATDTSADSTDIQPLVAGTGTQDRIAKWTDNAGTLGDSGITESGGMVGIGTTSPGSKLVVSSNSATLPPASGIARFAEADGVQTGVFADSFGTNPFFNVRRANGTAAAPSALQANQLIGVIGASGYGASTYMGTRARVAFWASQNWNDTANGTYLTFNTTADGTNTAGGTERLRIDSAGNVGIGTNAPEYKLDLAGRARFRQNVGSMGPADSAGFWLFQNAPVFKDRAFIGMVDDNYVGLYGSSFGWGLVMNTITGNVGIGTTNAAQRLHVVGNGWFTGNVGIGTSAPEGTLHVNGTEMLSTGPFAGFKFRNRGSSSSADDWVWYSDSNIARFWRAGVGDLMRVTTTGNVGIGVNTPEQKLHVNGSLLSTGSQSGFKFRPRGSNATNDDWEWFSGLDFDGKSYAELAHAGSFAIRFFPDAAFVLISSLAGQDISFLCATAAGHVFRCQSSLRYKTNIATFNKGVDLIKRLRPVTFDWKQYKQPDFGLIAEEVAEVEPLLVTHDKQGQVEGVKYDRIGVVAINAIKEQQAEIENLRKANERQQQQIDALKKLVCALKPKATACKRKQ